MTPFNFKRKPRCKFCGELKIDWVHLIFECHKIKSGLIVIKNYLTKIKSFKTGCPADKRFIKLKRVILKLWHAKKLPELLYLFLSINLDEFGLNYSNILSAVVSITSGLLYDVKRLWESYESEIETN